MKILLVGGGGREDAIFRNLREHGHDVHVCMSNRNPSIISGAASYHIVKETDWNAVRDIAVKTKPDLVYVSPDGALDTPLVDSLMDSGLAVASPSRSAARIETSKEFMRSLLSRHGVEGNVWNATVSSRDELIYALGELNAEFVVKPLGLTGQ
ncbi:MAG: hypothetical protein M1162_02250 [Candidatus Thermoplasmatota archaeon]|nr:hypothetical protein [Candidatus Thermoplasmatota archaeon]